MPRAAPATDAKIRYRRESERQKRATSKAKAKNEAAFRIASENARQRTLNIRTRGQIAGVEARTASRIQVANEIEKLRTERRAAITQNQQDVDAANRRAKFERGVVSQTSTLGQGKNTIFLLLGLFFVMIIIYDIVSNGAAFGNVLSGVATFIRGLSANSPLFVKNPPKSSNSTTPSSPTTRSA